MPRMHLSSVLPTSKDALITQNINCYSCHWNYKDNHIALYLQDNRIWAIVKDVFGKIMMLPRDQIKVGINGSITQDNLVKMIKYDRDKISAILSHNLTLWIIPKLEAACEVCEHLIKKAKEYEEQAKNSINQYYADDSDDNFNKTCKKYQKALDHYEQVYKIKNKNEEYTKEIEDHINVLKRKLYLFQFEQPMRYCLPSYDDRRKVKAIFEPFKENPDVFKFVLKSASSNVNEEENSPAENFTCAYACEFFKDYTSAAKSYLLLSRQQYDSGNLESSDFCIEKAKDLFSKLEKTLGEKSFAAILENVDKWPSKIINDIPEDNYFAVLLEENRLKKESYRFKEKAQKEAQVYNSKEAKEYNFNKDEKEKKFIAVCEAYKDAINHLNEAYNYIKNSKRNSQEIEKTIHELQKEYFEFKFKPIINSYLPSSNDQSLFYENVSSLVNKRDFFVNKKAYIRNLLKSIEQIPEEKRSLVDIFRCAYICEFLEDPISASQCYFLLCKKYLQNKSPELSVKCLAKADNLIREKTGRQLNNIPPIANFLEKLDIYFLNDLCNQTFNDNSYKSYLDKILLEKQEVRKAFETSLNKMKKYFDTQKPRCFICFNIDEPDVTNWLSNTLVPDLKKIEVKTIFAPEDLNLGTDLNNFQTQIRNSEFAIIACTPLLKKKIDEQQNALTGPTLEIKLAIERLNDTEKCETTYPIYLKGDKKSSCPSACLKLLVGKKLNISGKNTDFNYYFDAFNIFARMRKVNQKKLEKIKYNFKFEVNRILSTHENHLIERILSANSLAEMPDRDLPSPLSNNLLVDTSLRKSEGKQANPKSIELPPEVDLGDVATKHYKNENEEEGTLHGPELGFKNVLEEPITKNNSIEKIICISDFFNTLQRDIERREIKKAVKTLKRLFASIKSDISQLTVDYLFDICGYFDRIIISIEDNEKLDIADQIIKFLKSFPLENKCIQKRIAYLHLIAKIEEERVKEQEKQKKLLPYYTLILHLDKNLDDDIRKSLSRLFKKFLENNMDLFKQRLSYSIANDMEDNNFFSKFCSCLDSIESLKQCTSYVGELYREAGDALACTDVPINLQNKKKTLQDQIEKLITRSYTNTSIYPTSPTEMIQEDVQEYRDMFKSKFEECYNAFKNSNDSEIVRNFQKEQYERFDQFFNEKLLKGPYFSVLPPLPSINEYGYRRLTYDFRVVDSLGREELCPLSNIKGFILIEKDNDISTFEKFSDFLTIELLTLGEGTPTHLIGIESTDMIRRGLYLDVDLKSYICTPEKMASGQKNCEGYENKDIEKFGVPFTYLLLKSKSIQGHNSLFIKYQEELQKIQSSDQEFFQNRALQFLKFRLSSFEKAFADFDNQCTFNIKTQFVELINHLIADLSIYFNLNETNTLDIIDALVREKIVTAESGQLLKKTVSMIYLIRVRLQFLCISNPNNPLEECKRVALKEAVNLQHYPVLHTHEEKWLSIAYWLVLKPLYKKIQKFLNDGTLKKFLNSKTFNSIDLFDVDFLDAEALPFLIDYTDKFKELCLVLFDRIFTINSHSKKKRLIESVAQSITSVEEHLLYYQKLSKKNNVEFLREVYLKKIRNNESLFRRLEFIPNPYGYRQIEKRKRLQLQKKILSLTSNTKEEFEGFSVIIDGLAITKKAYLKKEVIKEILDSEGNLKKAIPGTNNNVVRLKYPSDLHFKQQPSHLEQSPFHPGKEQAVSRLMMRLFGHGVSFSELVIFTVNHPTKTKEYLVLISETVEGETLASTKKEDLKDLDKKRLSEILLSIPLIIPGDTRGVNCIFESTINEKGKPIKQLVSIDNDVAWVKPVTRKSKGRFSSSLVCQLYTVLFSYFNTCILDKEAIADFLNLKPDVLISGWLEELIEWNEKIRDKFKRFEKLPDFTPFCIFEEGTGGQVLTQFFCLQTFLEQHKNEDIQAIEILKTVISFDNEHTTDVGNFLYQNYRKAQTIPGNISQQIRFITGRDSNFSISMNVSNAAIYKNLPHTKKEQKRYQVEEAITEVRQLIAMSKGFFFRKQEGRFAKLERGFKTKEGEEPLDYSTQEVLLKALLIHRYDTLNLSYCEALTDNYLMQFLEKSGRTILSLDLRHCINISDNIIENIAKLCSNLKELYLSECVQIRVVESWGFIFSEPLSFPNLEVLHIARCDNLGRLRLHAPKLRVLKADNNAKLKDLKIAELCPSLKELYLSECHQIQALEDRDGQDLNFPNLEVLHIARCDNLERLKIHVPNLRALKADNNVKLKEICVDPFPSIDIINIDNCPLFTNTRDILRDTVFGQKEWEKHFGSIGIEPRLPANILGILNEPCSFWPDKKVKETHLLVLIPNTVNGKAFTMNYLEELIQKPKSGHSTKYEYYNDYAKEAVEDKSYPSHWVLMTRDIIPGSRDKWWKECSDMIANYRKKTVIPYELPNLLEATASILMHYVKTGERLYSDDPWTYTYIQDVSKDKYTLGVGGFAAGGLLVSNYCRSRYLGVAGGRKF